MTQISRFIEQCVPIAQRVTGDGDESAAPNGGGGFADYAFVSLHCLRIYLDTSYRMTIDLLKEMPQIIGEIGLDAADLPAPSTLCKAFDRIEMNLYTLLSDVQRNANTLRKDVSDVLLERVQHDRAVHGQYGSVQRTTRRQRSLKDDEQVLAALEDAGIAREQVVSVDREKVDEALDVVSVSESTVYDTDESEYVRKAEVDEERKETRLQGLKDRLAISDDPEAEVLRQEVDRLEQEIEELTEFSPGSSFDVQAEST